MIRYHEVRAGSKELNEEKTRLEEINSKQKLEFENTKKESF